LFYDLHGLLDYEALKMLKAGGKINDAVIENVRKKAG
jgi:hypothetical protein